MLQELNTTEEINEANSYFIPKNQHRIIIFLRNCYHIRYNNDQWENIATFCTNHQ